MRELIVIPRWGGTAASDFYPWLAPRAAAELDLAASFVPLLPAPGAPEPAATARAARDAIARAADPVVLAHSVGCRAALMAAAALPEGAALDALVCVAGWFAIDAPWPAIAPWLAEELIATERARARIRRLEVVISDDDPFTADHAATRAAFEALGARVAVVPGGRHFNGAEEPAVWDALRRAIAPRGG